jgi:hypothetical protein
MAEVDLGTLTCGIGACQRTVTRCVAGEEQTCTPGQPSPEVCNGIDDDCDGQVDNGIPFVGEPCDGNDLDTFEEGVYFCMRDGTLICTDTTP